MGYSKTVDLAKAMVLDAANILVSSDARKDATGTDWIKLKEFKRMNDIYPDATVRIFFQYERAGAGAANSWFQLKRNGSNIGIEYNSNAAGLNDASQDFSFSNAAFGDTYEVWGKSENALTPASVRLYRFYALEVDWVKTLE